MRIELPLTLFATIALLTFMDLMDEADEGWAHLITEGTATLVAVAGVALLASSLRKQWQEDQAALLEARQEADDARDAAQAWQTEADRFRREAQESTQALSQAIDAEFARWELSPAEAEVALLLLKGLSLKEVATVRDTSERTARSQAQAVYKKAGLSGRADLSAFFLEDLLAPRS